MSPTRAERRREEKALKKNAQKSLELVGRVEKRVCYVKMLVRNPYDRSKSIELRGLIDTGATVSVINQGLSDLLELRVVSHQPITVANGQTNDCPVVPVEVVFSSNGKELAVVTPIVTANHNVGFDMLIGMDLLLGGTLTVDGGNKTWKWSIPWPTK